MKTRFFASQTSPYNGSGEAAGTYVDALPAHAKAQDTWIPTLPVLTTVERLGIFAPRMLAWDSDLDALVVHDGSSWRLFADGTAADE